MDFSVLKKIRSCFAITLNHILVSIKNGHQVSKHTCIYELVK